MQSYGMTHVGLIRSVNQDAFYNQDSPIGCFKNVYVLADGMGGHQGGEVASKMSVDSVIHHIQESPCADIGKVTVESILHANQTVFATAVQDNKLYGMGTTLIVASTQGSSLTVGHVGDSRLYAMGRHLFQVTKDHSYVQELEDAGVITHDEAMHHPNKNQITRAVGVDKEVAVDTYRLELNQENDPIRALLICSDGLTNMVTEKQIEAIILKKASLKERCHLLIDEALKAGGTDNITCILLEKE